MRPLREDSIMAQHCGWYGLDGWTDGMGWRGGWIVWLVWIAVHLIGESQHERAKSVHTIHTIHTIFLRRSAAARRKELRPIPILIDRPPSDDHTLVREHLGDALIRKRAGRIF